MPSPSGGFTRAAPTDRNYQPVAITSVDVISRMATGQTRTGGAIPIDIGHFVGAIQVTPAIGDQWMVEKEQGIWKLSRQIPFNTAGILNTATQGQVQVGSGSGPLELNAAQINVNGPLSTQAVTTTQRPDAASVPAGTQIYDTDLGQPIWSNGTDWHDAAGHVFYTAHAPQIATATATSTAHWHTKMAASTVLAAATTPSAQWAAHIASSLTITAPPTSMPYVGIKVTADAALVIINATTGTVMLRYVPADATLAVTATPTPILRLGDTITADAALVATATTSTVRSPQAQSAASAAATQIVTLTATSGAQWAAHVAAIILGVTATSTVGTRTVTVDATLTIIATTTTPELPDTLPFALSTVRVVAQRAVSMSPSLDITATPTSSMKRAVRADASLGITATRQGKVV